MKTVAWKTMVCKTKLNNIILLYLIGFAPKNGIFDYSRKKNIVTCKNYKNSSFSKEVILINGFKHISESNTSQNKLKTLLDKKPHSNIVFDFTTVPGISHKIVNIAKSISNYHVRKFVKIAHYTSGLFENDTIGFFWNPRIINLFEKKSKKKKAIPSTCTCSQPKCFLKQSTRIKSKKALLLGHNAIRELNFFNNLLLQEELFKTSWSLPNVLHCKLPICKFLPKKIPLDTKNEYSIYKEHGYSIVHESVVQFESNYTWFLTEKTFETISHGHPFIQVCIGPVWNVLQKMGFKPMSPLLQEDGLTVKNINECSTSKYAKKVVQQMRNIEQAPRKSWFLAKRNAGYNRYIFECKLESFLQKTLEQFWTF